MKPTKQCKISQKNLRPDQGGRSHPLPPLNTPAAGNRCHFVLLDNNESCPTAERSDIGRPNGQAYYTGELLDTTLDTVVG